MLIAPASQLRRVASERPAWLPLRLAHADWGSSVGKCVVATAELEAGVYRAHAPRTVLDGGGLLERMHLGPSPGRHTLLGFDFPLGVPEAYARNAAIDSFSDWFRQLDLGSPLFDIPGDISEVSTARPFFPRLITEKAPGIKQRFHRALGLTAADVLRRCDRAHCKRRAAAEMFWTIGPAAVGKATLAGWRHALRPALAEPGRRYSMWPFDGPMTALLASSDAVIVETYPTEAYHQLGLGMGAFGTAKTRRADRRADAPRLLDWCARNAVSPDDELLVPLLDGFGSDAGGEDRFDAVVGLFGMIDTMRRRAEPELPDDPAVRLLEGWIFGRHAVCPTSGGHADR